MTVLFVCTGNICRSAFAEAVARVIAPGHDFASAGTYAVPGNSATPDAIRVAKEFGVDLSGHRARQLTEAELARSDHVYGATREHVDAIRGMSRGAPVSLLDPDGAEIADPYGESADFYRRVFREISDAITARFTP